MESSNKTSKRGAHVYLALANLLQLMGEEDAAGLLDERTLSAMPLDLAYITDFTTRRLNGLESELFTAFAVGGLLVKACMAERVILPEPDAQRGLAVRLHVELSASLSVLVRQLNETAAKAALMLIAEQLPGPAAPVGSWSFLGQAACNQTGAW